MAIPQNAASTGRAPNPSLPAQLGPYRPVRKLGEGRMGAVYLAADTRAQRQVAVKVFSGPYATQPEYLAHLAEKVRAAAQLVHENLAATYELAEHEGQPYLVMEYCEGEGLDIQLSQTGALTIPETLEVMLQAAHALQYAHARGVIHGNLRPSRIRVTPDGVVKLLGLGQGRELDSADPASMQLADRYVAGRPHYAAPEQAQAGSVPDGRADIYSLGAIFYQCLAGRPPFEGPTLAAVLAQQVQAQLPSPRDLNPQVSESLALIVRKMLAKTADHRYADCAELADDLERVRQGHSPTALALAAGLSSVGSSSERGAAPAAPRVRQQATSGSGRQPAVQGGTYLAPSSAPAAAPQAAPEIPYRSARVRPERGAGGTSPLVAVLGVISLLLVIVLAGLGYWMWSSRDQPAPTSGSGKVAADDKTFAFPAPTPEEWKKGIPLLPLVDPARDAIEGKWEKAGETLVVASSKFARLELPYQPPVEYDFRVVFSRESALGSAVVMQYLAKDSASFVWVMGSTEDRLCGFALVQGLYENHYLNPTQQRAPRWLGLKERHTSLVQVRNGALKAWFDGKVVCTYKTSYGDLTSDKDWKLRNEKLLGLGSHLGAVTFYSADVVEVSGQGQLQRK